MCVEQKADHFLRKLLEECRLPVVARALGKSAVDERIHHRVRHGPDCVERRCPDCAQRLDERFAGCEVATMADRHGDDLVARTVWRVDQQEVAGELVGRVGGDLLVRSEGPQRLRLRVGDEPAQDRIERMGIELQRPAIPKLPPPPRRPQSSSGSVSALTCNTSPSAVTSSTDTRLSTAPPKWLISHPIPPPSVSPATPVVEITAPVVASPCW